MPTLTINTQHKSNGANQTIATIALVGTLDNSTVALLEEQMKPILEMKPAQLVFDLAALKFVTSAGIRLFFMGAKKQKIHQGQTSFVNLQPQIKEVFAIMGSIPDMNIFTSQAELDSYLLNRQKTYLQ
jgi:anti-anti-sigma factor